MALTDIQKIRLECGLVNEAESLLSDDEIQYFLTKNNNSIKKASLDAAKTVLFILSQQIHERSDYLEIWGHTWFENYMKALKLYITNPNYSITVESAQFYAGGISKSDIRSNIDNADNFTVASDIGIPKDYSAVNSKNTQQNIFDTDADAYNTSPFNI